MRKRKKPQYPTYTTGQYVRLTSDIICTPFDGKPPFVLFAAGQVGIVEKNAFGNNWSINFKHWSGHIGIHASRLEAVAAEDLTGEEMEMLA